ncbi:hypothetical protein FQN49_001096, partial [Arthroderma sp. PD_2]
LLLDWGGIVNAEDDQSWTPLQRAVKKGHLGVVKLLFSRRSDVYIEASPPEKAPVILAAKYGHKDIAQILLEKGANVNGGVPGMTPLCLAAMEGHKDIVQLLLNWGAKIDDWSCRNGGNRPQYHETPLHRAVEGGHEDIVKLLLEKGRKLEEDDFWHGLALHHAQVMEHEGIIQLLLEKGADAATRHFIGEFYETRLFEDEPLIYYIPRPASPRSAANALFLEEEDDGATFCRSARDYSTIYKTQKAPKI